MSLPILDIPVFPNVPPLPGVPPLLRQAATVVTIVSHYAAQSTYFGTQTPETWGVFDAKGNIAVSPDSFVAVEYRKAFRTSDYPQEQGAFQSYNKVAHPFDVMIRMTCGGSVEKRTQFLSTLESMVASVALFTVITPEVSYASANLERFDYRREARNGAHLIIADLMFREIRSAAVPAYASRSANQPPMAQTATKTPTAAASLPDGNVQPTPVPSPAPPYTQQAVH